MNGSAYCLRRKDEALETVQRFAGFWDELSATRRIFHKPTDITYGNPQPTEILFTQARHKQIS